MLRPAMDMIFLVLLAGFEVSVAVDSKFDVIAHTETGPVRGVIGKGPFQEGCPASVMPHTTPPSWLRVSSFYGIPFAESPTGDLRFRPPRAKKSWGPDALNAQKPGPSCPQSPLMGHAPPWLPHWAGWSRNEDCLQLNVWTASNVSAGASDELRPVIVWLYPGSFVAGNPYSEMGCPLTTGQPWAADEGIVVVSVNYRLGFLGFADLPELHNEEGTAGNYGLQDQRLALEWVQRNIKSFGGDPAKVTIMGESSGAASVLYHTVLPRSQGLFSRAIVQSAYDGTHHEGTPNVLNSRNTSAWFADKLGCKSDLVRCLRSASVDKVLDAQEYVLTHLEYTDTLMAFAPTADGYEMPEGTTLLQEIKRNPPKVPLLIGSNLNETSMFFCSELKDDTTESDAIAYSRKIAQSRSSSDFSNDELLDILKFYPVGQGGFDSHRSAVVGFSTDALFGCAARYVARAMPAHSEVYRYVLGRSISPARAADKAAKCLGVPHTMDVFYVFSAALLAPLGHMKGILFDAGDQALAQSLSKAWTSFIRGEAPKLAGIGVDTWPRWNNSQEALVMLDSSAKVLTSYRSEACDALESAGLVAVAAKKDAATVLV